MSRPKGSILSKEHREKISNAHKGKVFSDYSRKKMSLAKKGKQNNSPSKFKAGDPSIFKGKSRLNMQGKNHWNWKGGITPKNQQIRVSIGYKLWRKSVFERDDYTCIWCGARSCKGEPVILHADHIKPFAYYPELRFAIDNGRTLCVPCHKTTQTYAGNGKKYKRID